MRPRGHPLQKFARPLADMRSSSYGVCSEKYYVGIANHPSLKTKLCGSWSTLIGENDTFIHILEHEASYAGYDEFLVGLKGRQVSRHARL